MNIIKFRKIILSDICDTKYTAWSRVYEYPLVLDIIEEFNTVKNPKIHNTSWGFEGVHVMFKEDLDSKYNVLHSDIKSSSLPNTAIWDITSPTPEKYINEFDIVINVSTVEEVNFDHLTIFNNLLKQVKKGGLLIITFDLPGLQLEKFEGFLGQPIERFSNELSGGTSVMPNLKYTHLSCGVLVIRK